MRSLLLLIPISLALMGLAIWAFSWAVRRGQFDDLDTPALDILADDAPPPESAPARPEPEPEPESKQDSTDAARAGEARQDDAG